jgi:hypothetical protein
MFSGLKKAVPAKLKRSLRGIVQNRAFALQAQKLRPGTAPGRNQLAELVETWDNDGFTADVEYLQKVCEFAAATPGPVLECGSGLTTVLLSILAGQRGVNICALEHIADWRNRQQKILQNSPSPGTRVELCRLIPYEGFDWYELPREFPDQFRLVICDGPPGNTRGGRYGFFPVCGRRLSADCTILLDDAERSEERSVVHRWSNEFGAIAKMVETGHGAFAEIRLR